MLNSLPSCAAFSGDGYCAWKSSKMSEYFDWQVSQSTFSDVLETLYSNTTLNRRSTSSSVHTNGSALLFLFVDLDLLDFSFEFDMFTLKINQKHKQNLLTRVKIARSKRHRGLVISDSACSLSSSNEFKSDSYRFRGYVWTVENATNPDTCGRVNFWIRNKMFADTNESGYV